MQDQSVAAPRIRFGPFELDVRSGELRKGPTRLKVPDQSIQVLKALLDRPGELVTREELQQRLWPSKTFVDFEHGLNVAIRRLREALGDSADAPAYIETLPRRGYRFIGPIEDAAPPAAPPAPPLTRIRSWHLAAFAAAVFVTGVVVWFGHAVRDSGRSAERAPARSVPVTSMPGLEVAPALSPDGKYVAFAWQKDNPDIFDLYVKLIDGGDPVQLTRGPDRNGSPAWSPDGLRIAFVRGRPGKGTVIIIPAFGGPEQVVTETEAAPANGVGWTPDGNSLVIVDRAPPAAGAIFLCSRDTAERRELTYPTRDFYDGNPAVSPDGRYLAFVRRIAGFSGGQVFVQPLDRLQPAGEPRRLTQDFSTNALDWAADSRTIIFDGKDGLWRVAVEGGDPVAILTNVHATHPSVARDGSRLVYSRRLVDDSNIWMIPGPQPSDGTELRDEARRLIDSTFTDGSPQFSPQGDRIAFVSGRTGPNEIWVSRSDGSRPMQLTTIGAAAGSPRWNPDGTSIAFDSMQTGSWNIYVVGSQGGAVRPITHDSSNNVRPSWSGDRKWIYFGSNRGGDWQIWKIPAGGGAPMRITTQGGLEAFESVDGEYLYYTRQRPRFRGIWRVPVDGGAEVQVVDRGIEGSWAVTRTGIFMMHKDRVPQASVEFFDFATRTTTTIRQFAPSLHFDMNNPSFAVARDSQRILYVQFDQWGADIEMLPLR
jgi:Tol biopolymer transport system component/DNA-binding winged helix-turn-helix (wHTH) protein